MVDLVVNVLEHALDRRRLTFLGELRRGVCLSLQGGIDRLVLFLVDDLFCDQPVLKNPNRVVFVLVFFDLLLLAVATLLLGVSN